MVDSARKLSPNVPNITYSVGDCASPTPILYDGGAYDIVLGSWLLNYASNPQEMAHMFATAFANLKPGGRFVCIMPHPTSTPRAFMEEALKARPRRKWGEYWIEMTPLEDVDEGGGVRTGIEAQTKTGWVEFKAYHLPKEVYLRAAREGGFDETPCWRGIVLPEKWDDGGFGNWVDVPHFGLMTVTKGQ